MQLTFAGRALALTFLFCTSALAQVGEEDFVWDDIHEQIHSPLPTPTTHSHAGPKTVYFDRFFFAAERADTGRELFWTPHPSELEYPVNGSNKGYDDVNPASMGFGLGESSNPRELVVFCDQLFFVADGYVDGNFHKGLLYRVDKNVAPLQAQRWAIEQGSQVFDGIQGLTIHRNQLWFLAEGRSPFYGLELGRYVWRLVAPTNGNPCYDQMVHLSDPSAATVPVAHELESCGNWIGVSLNIGFGMGPGGVEHDEYELWVVRQSLSEKRLISMPRQRLENLTFRSKGSKLYYTAEQSTGTPGDIRGFLWVNSIFGSPSSEVPLRKTGSDGNFYPYNPKELTIVDNDRLYCSAVTDEAGRELWVTRGSAGSTRLVEDLNPGPGSSSPFDLIPRFSYLYFLTDGASGFQDGLWRTKGSTGYTLSLADVNHPNHLHLLDNGVKTHFYFAGDMVVAGAFLGNEVWGSNGTTWGTRPIWDANPGPASSYPDHFQVNESCVAFTGERQGIDRELAGFPFCEVHPDAD